MFGSVNLNKLLIAGLVRFILATEVGLNSSHLYELSPVNYCCQLTQHCVGFSTHSIIEGSYASDFLLSEITAAVFGEGGVVVNRVHGSHRQPFRKSDELRRHLCVCKTRTLNSVVIYRKA